MPLYEDLQLLRNKYAVKLQAAQSELSEIDNLLGVIDGHLESPKPIHRTKGTRIPSDAYGVTEAMYQSKINEYLLTQPIWRASATDIHNYIFNSFSHLFKEEDLKAVDGKKYRTIPKWRNRCDWQRQRMVNAGILEPTSVSGRGYWQLKQS